MLVRFGFHYRADSNTPVFDERLAENPAQALLLRRSELNGFRRVDTLYLPSGSRYGIGANQKQSA